MTRTAFIFGDPIGHSISPAIHNAAFRARGLDLRYVARRVPPAALPAAVATLRAPDSVGANITVPHKEAVLELVDELDPVARLVGAANTIQNRDGHLFATNTDSEGFARSLADAGWPVSGARVVLLGAGGAARAVAHAVLSGGADHLLIANRTLARADRLRGELAELFGRAEIEALPLDRLHARALGSCDVLVNTTTLGMHGEDSPVASAQLPDTAAVVDIIYNPPATPLLRRAEARGLRTLNGLPMLVYQAAAAWELWTGQSAPVDVMFEAARAALGQPMQRRTEAS